MADLANARHIRKGIGGCQSAFATASARQGGQGRKRPISGTRFAESPPHPDRICDASLSPQAGRGQGRESRNGPISASHSGRRRGCRGAGSRGYCCRCRGRGRAFRDRRRRAGRSRPRILPACRRAVPAPGRWWCRRGRCRVADRTACSRWRVAGMAARSVAAASPGRAGPARSLRRRRRSGGSPG